MHKPIKLYILTRQYQEDCDGLSYVIWGTTGKQVVKLIFDHQFAICFIKRDYVIASPLLHLVSERKHPNLKTLENIDVDSVYFQHQYNLRQFIDSIKNKDEVVFESDIKPDDRFLMERFVTSSCVINGGTILPSQDQIKIIKNPQLKPCAYMPELSWLSLDIETDAKANEIYSIAFYSHNIKRVLMVDKNINTFGMVNEACSIENISFTMQRFNDEKQLIMALIAEIRAINPDIIIGWNIMAFDLRVIENRANHYGIELNLARDSSTLTLIRPKLSTQTHLTRLSGRVVIDGIEMLRAAYWSFESFSLDYVADELLGKSKLIQNEDKVGEITRLFNEDKIALARYNLYDCKLVADIFEYTGLIEFAMQRSNLTGLSLGRLGGSSAAFDNLYLPRLHRLGYVGPNRGANQYDLTSPGGHVLNSKPGIYRNVLLFDFKSLYPSIIRSFSVDPLAMMQAGDNPIPGYCGAKFSRETSILPTIIDYLTQQREQANLVGNKSLSQAIKIIMNSFYGLLGSSTCRFYHPLLASSITLRGHEILQKTEKILLENDLDVIYGDTDSLFVWLSDDSLTANKVEQKANEIVNMLNEFWSSTLWQKYQIKSHLELEYEQYFTRFYMPTIRDSNLGSKKRYAGWVHKHNDQPRLVIKGLEAVRHDWTQLARNAQTQLLSYLFTDKRPEAYICSLVEKLFKRKLDDQLIYTKRLRKELSHYTKHIPPHVKAAKKSKISDKKIAYMMTLNGPEPLDRLTAIPDYQHYLTRQLRPALQGILQSAGLDFDEIINAQMRIF